MRGIAQWDYNPRMGSAGHGCEEARQAQDIRLVVDAIPTLAWSARPDGSAGTTSASLPRRSFSFHPFADIRRAVLKLHAIRFATHDVPGFWELNEELTRCRVSLC